MCWTMINAVLGLPADMGHGWSQPVDYGFDAPEMLAGRYVCHEGDPVRYDIAAADGGISVQKDGKVLRAEYCGGTLFHILDGEKLLTRAEFLLRDGRAWGARFGTRIFGREDD